MLTVSSELAGIDLDDLTNPYQAAATSALAFCIGAGLPLLAAAFIEDANMRILSVVCCLPFLSSLRERGLLLRSHAAWPS